MYSFSRFEGFNHWWKNCEEKEIAWRNDFFKKYNKLLSDKQYVKKAIWEANIRSNEKQNKKKMHCHTLDTKPCFFPGSGLISKI